MMHRWAPWRSSRTAALVAASELIQDRRIVFERLSRLGVTVLDVRPGEATARLVSTFTGLGFAIAYEKSTLEPTTFMEEHLGFAIDTERGLFLLTPKRERKLAADATDLLCRAARNCRFVQKRRLARFAGLAQSSSLAVPMARCWLRAYRRSGLRYAGRRT